MRSSVIILIFFFILLSCKDEQQDTSTERPEELEESIQASATAIMSLQGKWREPKYPFRQVHFRESTVKFIEEGVAEAPAFRKFRIAKECPFEVNNLKNLGPEDKVLVLEEAGACEKFEVSEDLLILSGHNVSTGRDYDIVYERME